MHEVIVQSAFQGIEDYRIINETSTTDETSLQLYRNYLYRLALEFAVNS